MTPRRPQVPGLNEEWAARQLDLLQFAERVCVALDVPLEVASPELAALRDQQEPLSPVCGSCTMVQHHGANGLSCDPERPGCPLHQVPEQTR